MSKNDVSEVKALLKEKLDDPWAARPLSLAGTARLIEFLANTLGDAGERAALEQTLKKEGGTSNPILALFKIFDGDRMAEMMSIVTGQSKSWVKKNWSLVKASGALKEFIENEDLGQVLGNLTESRDLLAGILAREASTGSPEPSTDSS